MLLLLLLLRVALRVRCTLLLVLVVRRRGCCGQLEGRRVLVRQREHGAGRSSSDSASRRACVGCSGEERVVIVRHGLRAAGSMIAASAATSAAALAEPAATAAAATTAIPTSTATAGPHTHTASQTIDECPAITAQPCARDVRRAMALTYSCGRKVEREGRRTVSRWLDASRMRE